ncbi:hypothetical protein DUI70_1026 [Streptomyces albus]|nr:hypothetical protein DUI70_1026 [Streptomyces albus]
MPGVRVRAGGGRPARGGQTRCTPRAAGLLRRRGSGPASVSVGTGRGPAGDGGVTVAGPAALQ